MSGKERQPDSETLIPLADILGRQFVNRWDLYPKQLDDGKYVTIYRPLRQNHLIAHLQGRITLGTYVLDRESNGRFLVFDADDEPDWRRLIALSRALANQDAPSYLEPSRRGGHLWLFLAEPRPGQEIRAFGQGLLAHFGIEGVELFPKQDKLARGPGSIIRLPFGTHRLTGRRYGFYIPDGRRLAFSVREQLQLLNPPQTIPEHVLGMYTANQPPEPSKALPKPPGEATGPVSERIKAAMTVRQFVLQYVELSSKGRGLCPFHDDQVASFSVNDDDNYWSCFACDTGGSIIDFWMKWQKCDFTTAVTELAKMLL
ncbi:MAG: CHC2 zinc finger domain-containing protein [Nitrososphaera sp.]|nr:CHC2 zinc finger domain-containing protein [Nitrososphaera sp.]